MTHQELKVMLLKDPAFRAAYEAESQNPQSPLVRIMYIMLNAMSYSITSSLIAASSHINTMTVIPFMHVNAAL